MIRVRLKQILESKNKTMYSLAKETGISHASVINMANEKTEGIKYENLDKICEILKCQPGDILEHIPRNK